MATQNLAQDDQKKSTVPGQNQQSGVLATPGQTTTASNAGTATGVGSNPGSSSGTGKNANANPGKRLFNPLSKLSSYTYNLTLYMITPDAYEAFKLSGRTKIDALSTAQPIGSGTGGSGGAFIVAQSGGINNKTSSRAPGFELDYYIDNLKVTTTTSARATGTSAFTGDVTFTITEPYGFSFISNLKRANEALVEYSNKTTYKENTNAFRQMFILGIRFYGYDKTGNLVSGTDVIDGEAIDPFGGTANLFEQFHEIQINHIKFTLNGKTAVYTLTGSNPDTSGLLGTKRGRIVKGGKYRGSTVHEMLTGPNGLFTFLNKEQQDKISKNKPDQKFANKYEVVYVGDAYERIGLASMVLASDLNKWRWPGSEAKTTVESNDANSVSAVPDNTQREFIVNSDTAIMQAITQLIQKSTFMEKALIAVYNNVPAPDGKQKNLTQVQNDKPMPLAWFNISADITGVEWDPIISDWAYTTKYIVSVYEIPSVVTPFSANGTKYYGPHKRYSYFFTGQNSEVLDFSLSVNNAYQMNVITTPGFISPDTPAAGGGTTSGGTMTQGSAGGKIPTQTGVTNPADSTGSLNTSAEAQNNVATQLLDPTAYASAKLKIFGDPDFLIRPQLTSIIEFYNKFYGSDGFTISAHGGTVYIEVEMKESMDYKNSTGLQMINEDILFIEYPESVKKVAKGIIFEVLQVTSTFANGKFEQVLDIKAAQSFTDKTEEKTQNEAGREGAGTATQDKSGAAAGNTKASGANTGQRADPPPPGAKAGSPANAPGSTNTVGNPTSGTVNTPNGQTADDELQPVAITSRKVAQQPRESDNLASKSDAELFALGYMPDEIANIRGGRG